MSEMLRDGTEPNQDDPPRSEAQRSSHPNVSVDVHPDPFALSVACAAREVEVSRIAPREHSATASGFWRRFFFSCWHDASLDANG
jgi:hypothetical protein